MWCLRLWYTNAIVIFFCLHNRMQCVEHTLWHVIDETKEIAHLAKQKCPIWWVFRPNRLRGFGLMPWRIRPALWRKSRPVFTQVCHTDWRDKLLTDARVQQVRSAVFFSEFFGDVLASYQNSSISCILSVQNGRNGWSVAWLQSTSWDRIHVSS